MPVMDGFDFLSEIEKRANARAIPVLVVTGKNPTSAEAQFLRERVEGIIQKDGEMTQHVLDRIQSILTKK